MHEIAGAIIAITFWLLFIPVAFMSGPVEVL
jgi:multidrug efflux pump subunit AcrB